MMPKQLKNHAAIASGRTMEDSFRKEMVVHARHK
jgi:hypothetical protein